MNSLSRKKALKSKGVQGSVLVIVAILAPLILKRAGLDDVLGGEALVELVSQGLVLLGAGLAGLGRIFAKERIR